MIFMKAKGNIIMKIKVNNKIFELTNACKFEIKNNLLFNKNQFQLIIKC